MLKLDNSFFFGLLEFEFSGYLVSTKKNNTSQRSLKYKVWVLGETGEFSKESSPVLFLEVEGDHYFKTALISSFSNTPKLDF